MEHFTNVIVLLWSQVFLFVLLLDFLFNELRTDVTLSVNDEIRTSCSDYRALPIYM